MANGKEETRGGNLALVLRLDVADLLQRREKKQVDVVVTFCGFWAAQLHDILSHFRLHRAGVLGVAKGGGGSRLVDKSGHARSLAPTRVSSWTATPRIERVDFRSLGPVIGGLQLAIFDCSNSAHGRMPIHMHPRPWIKQRASGHNAKTAHAGTGRVRRQQQ